ncbi:23S rRNA (uracil(1939)-C(5))-methyltransferase RlmD [Lysobacter capsici]|uniref:23S rRNA (uracil(1939)-C(5))-methyltransferase RlmD n=1 Tax=Lysobacter capsici TaxID=435897 RepID=UPI00287B7C08|nr:23S rRNA (uracil(1939)-C(5))-methyltransferase RlmD [Lysobacter capsici]WND83267.1 23S rRNA (uracil(1939)-C(5))-methyltransferase RlmD [Lysobacter capsici]WND88464.1 23S rRNA (uracil(1939)-C(5))-methyltransferase RlmD [Lysobacter capsici]
MPAAVARIDQTPFEAAITGLTHDGRGVARRADGKAVFVAGALPGERVMAKQTSRSRSFDEAVTLEVLEAAADRVAPRCAHFGVCGGCALQHMAEDRQIVAKQNVLMENFERIGHVTPERILPALTDSAWGYRRKGRFSVRRVEKKDKTLVGFRETDPRFVAEIARCETVIPEVGDAIGALARLIDGLQARREIPQVELIGGDRMHGDNAHCGIALTFRHLSPLSQSDRDAIVAFAQQHEFAVFLQPGGIESVHPLWPADPRLAFTLPQWNLELKFRPLDFIQVNAGLNGHMIQHAIDLLQPQPEDRVLDLFAGLGNFTLPLARSVREVVGVEGEAGLVQRARENAEHNGLGNAKFYAADLAKDLSGEPWMREGFDRLLLDPPRSGADFVLTQLPLKQFKRIVYVSCHPASLARDAGYLVREKGWKLRAAGVMDMFPHTAHVESIAMFER